MFTGLMNVFEYKKGKMAMIRESSFMKPRRVRTANGGNI